MDTDLQRDLALGMTCIPDEARLREYAGWLAADKPSQTDKVNKTVDCYVQIHDAAQCLAQVSGGQASSVLPSNRSQDFCRIVVEKGEQALKEKWNLLQFTLEGVGAVFFNSDYRSILSPEERGSLNELTTFYARRLPDASLETVRSGLREKSTDWANRLNVYDSRSVIPIAPSKPISCTIDEWESHSLAIQGLSYSIPVHFPKGRALPWVFQESALRSEFEALKVFLTHQDLERILMPDLVLYLGGGLAGSDEVLQRCSLRTDDRGGEYSYIWNHIMSNSSFYTMSWETLRNNPLYALGSLWAFKTLHHEMGHALYFRLLTGEQRESIRRFYEAVQARIGRDQSLDAISFIPNYVLVDLTISNDVVSTLDGQHRTHAMKNEAEFFAEMFDEYVSTQLQGSDYYGAPFQARKAIMKNFLKPDGIHPEAFSQEAVEEAFRAAGVPLKYPRKGRGEVDLMATVIRNSVREIGAEIFIGGRRISAGRVLTYGGGLFLQAGFEEEGFLMIGLEGNLGLMPASWLGIDAVGRLGFGGELGGSRSLLSTAGLGGRLRFQPSRAFQFHLLFFPQTDLGGGGTSFDISAGIGFQFH
jgi:hypothetical protein